MANLKEARPAFLDHHLAKFATQITPEHRIKGRVEKYVLREAMKGLLPRVLYEREKYAFMAPPAHTDRGKWQAMMSLADKYLSAQAIDGAGLISVNGVNELFKIYENPKTSAATQVHLDAVIHHMLSVQIMHEQFIATHIPQKAAQKAEEVGWGCLELVCDFRNSNA